MDLKDNVVKLPPVARADVMPPDPAMLLVSALIVAAGPALAARAQDVLVLIGLADPGAEAAIARAGKLLAQARAMALAVQDLGAVQHLGAVADERGPDDRCGDSGNPASGGHP